MLYFRTGVTLKHPVTGVDSSAALNLNNMMLCLETEPKSGIWLDVEKAPFDLIAKACQDLASCLFEKYNSSPNSVYTSGYGAKGQATVCMSRTTLDPVGDVDVMNNALELVYAMRRGVEISDADFKKHVFQKSKIEGLTDSQLVSAALEHLRNSGVSAKDVPERSVIVTLLRLTHPETKSIISLEAGQ